MPAASAGCTTGQAMVYSMLAGCAGGWACARLATSLACVHLMVSSCSVGAWTPCHRQVRWPATRWFMQAAATCSAAAEEATEHEHLQVAQLHGRWPHGGADAEVAGRHCCTRLQGSHSCSVPLVLDALHCLGCQEQPEAHGHPGACSLACSACCQGCAQVQAAVHHGWVCSESCTCAALTPCWSGLLAIISPGQRSAKVSAGVRWLAARSACCTCVGADADSQPGGACKAAGQAHDALQQPGKASAPLRLLHAGSWP